MLKALIPEYKITSTNGSGVLKALQNENLPEIDLLVREAVQNSADAAIGLKGDSSNVYFTIGEFSPRRFNCELEGLTDVLNVRFPGEKAKFIEIRDSKTSGLTGPVTIETMLEDEKDHGNYFKLVFENGQEQTNSDQGQAGGSWGYGKSVYYRAGSGLVVFYSRIQKGPSYESRLVVSLVEHDETGKSMLKEIQANSLGRAWWGSSDQAPDDQILPVTDLEVISGILAIFGLEPFGGDNTGTAVIIPYIDEARLLKGIFPEECGIPEDEMEMCSWKDDLAEYINLSLQRWYAPKLFNKHLDQFPDSKWLMARVNNVPIRFKDMRPFFQLVQELYNVAISANAGMGYVSERFPKIKAIDIPSTKVEGGKAGTVATVRITADELDPNGSTISLYTYLRLFSKTSGNDPIVMFARTPGLVLDYKIDGKWANNLSRPESDDEYIVAFFVPRCEVPLKKNITVADFREMPLGEYLRKGEKSDHMDWEDVSGLNIIGNIKRQVINKVNAENKQDEIVPVDGSASKLSGRLGKRLLPSLSYGKKKASGGGSGGSGGGSINNLVLHLESPSIDGDSVELGFGVEFQNTKRSASIGFFVEEESGSGLDAQSWLDKIETDFPLRLEAIKDCKTQVKNVGTASDFSSTCTRERRIAYSKHSKLRMDIMPNGSTVSGFTIENEMTNVLFTGTLVFRLIDRKYSFEFKEVEHVKETR